VGARLARELYNAACLALYIARFAASLAPTVMTATSAPTAKLEKLYRPPMHKKSRLPRRFAACADNSSAKESVFCKKNVVL
jgi:hypothetical protein